MIKQPKDDDQYFWQNDNTDLDKGIYGRYLHGSLNNHSTVATIKRVFIDNEYVFHIKVIACQLPFECSTLAAAQEFTVAWFAPTVKEYR
jgi:hypothetical protein